MQSNKFGSISSSPARPGLSRAVVQEIRAMIWSLTCFGSLLSPVTAAPGRDRQLPAALAKVHPIYGTPYVGMIVTAAISITVALVMRFHLDELTSVVNFGALTGFLLLHVSVIALFWVKNRSGRWIAHLLVPVVGIIVVLAVLSGMSSLAMTLGVSWLGIGLAYGALLRRRRRTELAI